MDNFSLELNCFQMLYICNELYWFCKPVVDEHGVGGGAVLGKLPVAGAWGDHGQLDGVEWVTGEDLRVETGVDHGGLLLPRPHQVDGLGHVLLTLWCVGRHNLQTATIL